MWIIVFLLNVYFVSGTCLNGGENHDGTCVCQDGYTGRHCQIEPYNSCVKGAAVQTLSNSAVVSGSPYPLCDGTNDNCYYRPGLPVSSKCLATFGSCNDHSTADHSATCDNGCTAGAFQEDCCIEHAKCEDHVCAKTIGQDTDKERAIYNVGDSSWVIMQTDNGACKDEGDWYFDKVTVYKNISAVIQHCQTFVEFVNYGYVCHKTGQTCDIDSGGYLQSAVTFKGGAVKQKSACDSWKWETTVTTLENSANVCLQTSAGKVYRQVKTHTATDVTNYVTKFDTPVYLSSLESIANNECCSYTKTCEDYNSQCALPLKNVGSDISENGDTPSECCEPKTWRCDHSGSACGTGFKVNTERCGQECATSFETTLLGEYTGIPITSGSKNNCIGDEQGILTSADCLEKCKGRSDNYFIKNDICYCADGITSQCVADVGSACDCNINHKTFAPGTPGYHTVSANTLTVCISWTRVDCNPRDGWDYLDIQEGGGFGAGQYQACVKGSYGNYYSGNCGTGVSNTCCDPIRYDTYRIDTAVTRNENLCCDIDTDVTLTACLSQACPERHSVNGKYETGFYETSHTTECCTEIAKTNYCDTFANGAAFDCQNGQVPSGVLDCGGTCLPTDCCKDAVPCDEDRVCGGNNAIDTNYRCSELENGACHSDEYTGTSACCKPDNCDSSGYYSQYSGEYNYHLSSPRNYVGDPKSGCTSKNDWFSVYKPGYLTTTEPTEFEEKCCRYFERCNEDICSDVQVVKSRSSDDLYYITYCWDTSGNDVTCTAADQATCCEAETCQTARETYSCPDTQMVKQDSDALGRRITDESDFQNSCCENLPPFYTTTRIDKIISGGGKLYTFIYGGWGESTFNRWTLGGAEDLSKKEQGLVDMALDGTDLYLAYERYGTNKFYKISGDLETTTPLGYTPSKIAAADGRYAVLSKNPTNLYLDDVDIAPSDSYMSWNSRIDMSKDWIAMSADGYLSMRDIDGGSWTHFSQCSSSSEVINSNVQIAGTYVAAACSNDKIYIWKYGSSWVLHKSISGYSMQIAMSDVYIAIDLRGEIKVYELSSWSLEKTITGYNVNSMTFVGNDLFIATYNIQSDGTYIQKVTV